MTRGWRAMSGSNSGAGGRELSLRAPGRTGGRLGDRRSDIAREGVARDLVRGEAHETRRVGHGRPAPVEELPLLRDRLAGIDRVDRVRVGHGREEPYEGVVSAVDRQ